MFPVVTVVVKLVLADVVAVSLAVVLWLVVAETESELLPVEDAVVVADDDAVTDAELVWLEEPVRHDRSFLGRSLLAGELSKQTRAKYSADKNSL